jgi:hypothetical protein
MSEQISCWSIFYDFLTCKSLQNWSCNEADGCNLNGQNFCNTCLCCELSLFSWCQKTCCLSCVKK